MKITYLCPATSRPSGGVKRLFRHVKLLVDAGYKAQLGLPANAPPIKWFEWDIPVIHSEVFHSEPGDVYVVPDGFIRVLEALKDQPVRKVVIALGFLSPFYGLEFGKDYSYYNVDAVMTNNKSIASFLYFSKLWPMHKGKIFEVETSIDKRLFLYNPKEKEKLVAFYSKHNDEQMQMMIKIMHLKGHQGWQYVQLSGYDMTKYAEILRKASVFVCQMFCEGFSVPILEAMACGCLCVGSHGSGGERFIVDNSVKSLRLGRSAKNFISAKPGDLFDFAKKLNMAMDLVDANREPELSTIRQNGLATAAQYTEEEEVESVLQFWKEFLK
jgi:glycosyltransferase involved in cell wall biosynthesis